MNFRDLEYIIAVSTHLNFSKAAAACNVSQPSLSAQIKKLEAELGNEIFLRNTRKIQLSPFGESTLELARQILSRRDSLKQLSDVDGEPSKDPLRLGGIFTIAPYLFPSIINALKEDAPATELSLTEAKTEDLLTALLNGELDAAVLTLPTDRFVFHSKVLLTEPFYVAVSKDHPLAGRGAVDDNDLNGLELLLLEEGHCFRDQAFDVCRETGAHENQSFKASSLETIRECVSTSDDATLMPSIARKQNDGICYLPINNDKYARDIGIIWRRADVKPQIEQLVPIIAKACQQFMQQQGSLGTDDADRLAG